MSNNTQTDTIKNVVEIHNLSKKYGTNTALDNISFNVKKGEIMGFLGPNGAGKSTTMNIVTGYLAASKGTVKIDGIDISDKPIEARRKIGYLPEIPPLYTEMTVYEYLSFAYDLKQADKKDKEIHLCKIMNMVKISGVKSRLIKNLSKGYRQRVGLAQALIGNPDVLILDEPTVGLDPKQILEMRNVIKELGKERTIILSTHIMQEVSAICDSYIIINRGKIAASGQISELEQEMSANRYKIRVKCGFDQASKLLNDKDILNIENAGETEPGTTDINISSVQNKDIREKVFFKFADAGCAILSFEPAIPSLEDIFMRVISSDVTPNKSSQEVKSK